MFSYLNPFLQSQSESEDSSWSEEPSSDQDNKIRYPREIDPIRGPRDAYLRPMIDARGIRQRLAFKSQVAAPLSRMLCPSSITLDLLGCTLCR